MVRKGQIKRVEKGAAKERVKFINQICRSGCIEELFSKELL